MDIELYAEVALTHDIPEEGLRSGDVATLVDWVQHPGGAEGGAVLELFNALGDSIAVVTVPKSAIAPLRSDQVLTVRPLGRAV